MDWKERLKRTYHDWLQVFFYLCFFYSCGKITEYYLDDFKIGIIVSFILFAFWAVIESELNKE